MAQAQIFVIFDFLLMSKSKKIAGEDADFR
jgi:hypothetical protein